MRRSMIAAVIISMILSAAAFVMLKCFEHIVFLTFTITFAVTAYHLAVRLTIGLLYNVILNNKVDVSKKCFRPHAWETKLYHILKVKKWKNVLPTFDPKVFSIKERSCDEVAMAMCQAELVHKTCAAVSFLPVIAAVWLGSFWAFFITSSCAAALDMVFVIIQRYNRPRVIETASMLKARKRR